MFLITLTKVMVGKSCVESIKFVSCFITRPEMNFGANSSSPLKRTNIIYVELKLSFFCALLSHYIFILAQVNFFVKEV